MANNQITKVKVGDRIKEVIGENNHYLKSLSHITDYCNISRNTFYYHFQDKYELINWVFYTDML